MVKLVHALALFVVLAALPRVAGAVVEPESKMEYPDTITVEAAGESYTLRATGVGLREKTFLQVDVYVIVSYILADAELGEDPAAAIRTQDVPKRIQMDLLRGFSREKLVNSFTDVIEKNYEDTSAFAAELETFLAYFDRDAEEDDQLVFSYLPDEGLTTTLNGEIKGTIAGHAFAEALWTVWFGEKPADDGLQRELLAALGG
jgi:long-chain acyl-CoA synthetase